MTSNFLSPSRLMVGFRGDDIPPWLEEMPVAGILLFDYNVSIKSYQNNILSKSQIKKLCKKLHQLPSHPLIFVDQEGGKVRRLKERLGFQPLCSAKEFASLPKAKRRDQLRNSFGEMVDLGIHWNLAPVVDLAINPNNPDLARVDRCYSDDANTILDCIYDFSIIARETGLKLCLKHYPGMGSAQVNSHEAVTDISGSLRWDQLNLFHQLVDLIPGHGILLSHGIVREWSTLPTSLALPIYEQIRHIHGTSKVTLITDDLQMAGLRKLFSLRKTLELLNPCQPDFAILGNNLIDDVPELLKLYSNS